MGFPGKNTGVGSYSLLQGIFLTQRLEPESPALQADSLPSEPPGKPLMKLTRKLPQHHSERSPGSHCNYTETLSLESNPQAFAIFGALRAVKTLLCTLALIPVDPDV